MIGIPRRETVKAGRKGRGRARLIRLYWAERCSFAEIAAALRVDTTEVTRTLRRPVQLRTR